MQSGEDSTANSLSERKKPRNALESKLGCLWSAVLNVRDVSINDNFIALGGDSLLLIRLQILIYETFDVFIPVEEMTQRLTIEVLATYISANVRMCAVDEGSNQTPQGLSGVEKYSVLGTSYDD